MSANNFQIARGGAEESERLSSFSFVSGEEANGTVKRRANVSSSCPLCDAVVCVSESAMESAKVNGQRFWLCYVEVQIESASVTGNEMNS